MSDEIHDEIHDAVTSGPVVPGGGAGARSSARGRAHPERIGSYKILETLGEGGFGTVYLAEQSEPVRRRVALKVIKLGMDTKEVLGRFEAERQALAMMDHANVARVLDAGMTDDAATVGGGRPYFVMEHVAGVSITEHCDRQKLTIRERLELFIQVCHAVQHAHQKGIIHRDLKPSNILVTVRDGAAIPKVIDFGVAKALYQNLAPHTVYTEQGQLIGTAEYMSPEQAEMSAQDIDTRSDIYALGVLLYELLAGSRPFEAAGLRHAGVAEIQRAIREIDPPRPSTRLSSQRASATAAILPARVAQARRIELRALTGLLRHDLDWVVMKCLEKNRERRYETADALAMDIRRFLRDEPLLAGPPSVGYRFSKFARRNRIALGVTATIAIVMVAATVVSVWFAMSAERARDEEARRAGELEAVTRFQAEQLGGIDAAAMGLALRAGLREKLAARSAHRTLGRDETEAILEEYGVLVEGADFTGLALETLGSQVFDPSIGAIDRQFGEQPLVRARLLQALAGAVRKAGLLDSALPPQEEALAIRRAELGDGHPDTLASVNSMGALREAMGDFAGAEQSFREALAGRRSALGDDHPQTLTSIASLGAVVGLQGRHAEAEAHLREALEGQRRVLGDDDPSTLSTIGAMGVLSRALGRTDDARRFYREALDSRRRVLGNDHLDTLQSCHNMGVLLRAIGEAAEAVGYYRAAMEGRRRVLGHDHPRTLNSVMSMGMALKTLGKLQEAEPYFREAVEGCRRVLDDDHPQTLRSIDGLSGLLVAQGRLEEAEPLQREAIDGCRRRMGDIHAMTLMSISNLGVLLSKLGRLPESERYTREALEGRRRALGDDHRDTLASLHNMASLLRVQGRLDDAETYFAEAIERKRRILGDTHPSTLTSITGMAGVQELRGKLAEAEALYREALVARRERLGDDHPATLRSINNLALLVQEQDRLADADVLLREALEGRRRTLGDDHRSTIITINNMGRLLREMGRLDEAEALGAEAVMRGRTAFRDGDWYLGTFLGHHARTLVELQRFDESETRALEAYAVLESAVGPGHERTRSQAAFLADLYEAWHEHAPGLGHDRAAAEWRARLGAS